MIYRYGDMFGNLSVTSSYRVFTTNLYKGTRDKFVGRREPVDGVWTLFTANSYVNKAGELVMGRGAALRAKQLYPELPRLLGHIIQRDCGHLGDYSVTGDGTHNVGAFQVKRHFKSHAGLDIIRDSIEILRAWANAEHHTIFNLNFPGIGYGGLSIGEVEPLLQVLPDNVHIWRFENVKTA